MNQFFNRLEPISVSNMLLLSLRVKDILNSFSYRSLKLVLYPCRGFSVEMKFLSTKLLEVEKTERSQLSGSETKDKFATFKKALLLAYLVTTLLAFVIAFALISRSRMSNGSESEFVSNGTDVQKEG